MQNLKEGFDEMEDNAPSVTFRVKHSHMMHSV